MTSRASFYRKIAYLVVIAVLLLAIIWVGAPASPQRGGRKGGPGGLLAQLRLKYGMSEAQLGQIDPTSATMQLCTLGMRGVAVNYLWYLANNYKMKKDWTRLSATLEQIVRLEQHYVTVWRHQAWNLSYNVSAEFDDYRERFRWVIKGTDFLKEGIRYNDHEPMLVWDVGWFTAQKIGRADECKQFRRLFMDPADPYDIHGGNPPRDNWLVGKDWFAKAEAIVDARPESLKGTSPVIFFSDRPKSQMNYAEAMETDGTIATGMKPGFDEKAYWAWKKAQTEWVDQYGRRDIPTSYGEIIRLNDKEPLDRDVQKLVAQLEAMQPGLRSQMIQERRRELSDAERAALDTPPEKRTPEQFQLASAAEEKIKVTHEQVARRIKGENRKKAMELAKQAAADEHLAEIIARYRQIVNFENWRQRAEVEQSAEVRAAREFIYKGDQAFAENDPISAREFFRLGTAAWGKVLARYPNLGGDDSYVRDWMDIVERYVRYLDEAEELFPDDFGLGGLVHAQVEQNTPVKAARQEAAKADQAAARGDLVAARKAYESSMAEWRKVLDKYPSLLLMSDRRSAAELMDAVNRYAEVLKRAGQTFPADFAVQDFVRQQVKHADELAAARRFTGEADLILADVQGKSDLEKAKGLYDQGLAQWRKLLDKYPSLVLASDRQTAAELAGVINRYAQILHSLGQSPPEKFILQDFLDRNAPRGKP